MFPVLSDRVHAGTLRTTIIKMQHFMIYTEEIESRGDNTVLNDLNFYFKPLLILINIIKVDYKLMFKMLTQHSSLETFLVNKKGLHRRKHKKRLGAKIQGRISQVSA